MNTRTTCCCLLSFAKVALGDSSRGLYVLHYTDRGVTRAAFQYSHGVGAVAAIPAGALLDKPDVAAAPVSFTPGAGSVVGAARSPAPKLMGVVPSGFEECGVIGLSSPGHRSSLRHAAVKRRQ